MDIHLDTYKSPARKAKAGTDIIISFIYPLLLDEIKWHKLTLWTEDEVLQKGVSQKSLGFLYTCKFSGKLCFLIN